MKKERQKTMRGSRVTNKKALPNIEKATNTKTLRLILPLYRSNYQNIETDLRPIDQTSLMNTHARLTSESLKKLRRLGKVVEKNRTLNSTRTTFIL